MSSEKRLFLFLLLTFCSILGIQYLMDVTGLNPPPPRKQPNLAQVKKAEGPAATAPEKEKEPAGPAEAAAGKEESPPRTLRKQVAIVDEAELVLGSAQDHTPKGYRLEVRLQQKGAGVRRLLSSRYEAEAEEGRKQRHEPLKLLEYDPRTDKAPPSLAISLSMPEGPAAPADGDAQAAKESKETDAAKGPDTELDPVARAAGIASRGEVPLDDAVWEVVRDAAGRVARPIPEDAQSESQETGRALVFRTSVGQPEVVVTKTYRLRKGADGFEVELKFESPAQDRSLVYRLMGPHKIPIEGEWYTGTFRDVFFGQIDGNDVKIVTRSAYDIVKKSEPFQTLPLKFAGVENQYFAILLEPDPPPRTPDDRWDSEARGLVIPLVPAETAKANVTVDITSKPIKVGPNVPVTHTYKVFAGPKTAEALAPYGAEALASYRKNQWFGIPGAAWMATTVITPLLDIMYNVTRWVAQLFGGRSGGNYGVAIILLTLTVRMFMFPIGRKQAMAAKKMQDLQPLLKEIQEKYKDDKEQQTRETWSLYKKYKVNPLGGCLPALIQLPIFVGLWQALNNSVHLRHAPFLYIQNLAAPDMLFRLPFDLELPLVGKYFNLLPFLVVALMLVQTKLFSPPATTPEMEQQQKMMKYMMVFMAFMFYKVPSGLGLYFITSSLWQIGERLLLPKVTHAAPGLGGAGDSGGGGGSGPGGGGRRGGPGGGNGTPSKPPGKLAQFWGRILEEASKNPTYRNLTTTVEEREGEREREGDKDRDRGKPRARPGRRR